MRNARCHSMNVMGRPAMLRVHPGLGEQDAHAYKLPVEPVLTVGAVPVRVVLFPQTTAQISTVASTIWLNGQAQMRYTLLFSTGSCSLSFFSNDWNSMDMEAQCVRVES